MCDPSSTSTSGWDARRATECHWIVFVERKADAAFLFLYLIIIGGINPNKTFRFSIPNHNSFIPVLEILAGPPDMPLKSLEAKTVRRCARPLWHSIRAVWVDATGASVSCPSFESFGDLAAVFFLGNMHQNAAWGTEMHETFEDWGVVSTGTSKDFAEWNSIAATCYSLTLFAPQKLDSNKRKESNLSKLSIVASCDTNDFIIYLSIFFWVPIIISTGNFQALLPLRYAEVELAGAEAIQRLQLQWGIAVKGWMESAGQTMGS